MSDQAATQCAYIGTCLPDDLLGGCDRPLIENALEVRAPVMR